MKKTVMRVSSRKSISVFVLFCLSSCLGLYEDQAFKMDWIIENMDKPLEGVSMKDGGFVLLSRSGLLGRINPRGKIQWRHSLEPEGKVFDLDERNGDIRSLTSKSPGVVDLRTWSPDEGHLLKEEIKLLILDESLLKILDTGETEQSLKEIPIPSVVGRTCKRIKELIIYCENQNKEFAGYFDIQRINAGMREHAIEDDVHLMTTFRDAEGPLVMNHGYLEYRNGDSVSVIHPCSPEIFIELFLQCQGDKCSVTLDTETIFFKHNRDGSLLGNRWIRNEGMASIVAAHILPYWTDDNQSSNSSEEGSVSFGILNVFKRFGDRLTRHALFLKHRLENIFHREVNDFGIRKVIVAITDYGKVYGLDSKNGKILWQLMLGLHGFEDPSLFVLRSEGKPLCAVIFKNSNGHHVTIFNSMLGKVHSERVLEGVVTQAFSLHFHIHDDIRPIMIVMENGDVEIEPVSNDKKILQEIQKKQTYILSLKNKNNLIGSRVELKRNGGDPYVSKHIDDRVHSLGRVMADRSVLFKYVNPNLVAVLAESVDLGSITLLLVDMVTGRILFSLSHKRVSGPFTLVHSENWIVYSYYNEKSRRTEVGSLELFEGNTQRQSYILGNAHIMTMADTTTEKGITSKYLLMATSQGIVYNIPRSLLDPRRPNMNTPMDMREPGLLPYIPELHLSSESVLNYNRTIIGPKKIITAHTGLESTSIVFVYGADLYCTQVHPSKGFDLLKDDFDYYVIASVLMGLVIAAYATKKVGAEQECEASMEIII
ncbi:EMC1 [Lepeophtheirus salmonis]|uniref:ER membrane protein complex subunit 1 n=1 Tax=Lepeophtheirus salmonis TaxID=72036 RepID=A0A7R8H6F2_LEPSM|nr:EMC1 [Lepeophtheirus salmonis]CAF2881737.1 EMC1 [Lepeophtheirus salmonis]